MSKFKTIFWVLVLGLFGVLVYQNQDFLLSSQSSIKIFTYVSPQLPTAVYLLIFFAVGLLIAYLFGLAEKFRLKKTIKKMSAAMPPPPADSTAADPEPAPAAADSPAETGKSGF